MTEGIRYAAGWAKRRDEGPEGRHEERGQREPSPSIRPAHVVLRSGQAHAPLPGPRSPDRTDATKTNYDVVVVGAESSGR